MLFQLTREGAFDPKCTQETPSPSGPADTAKPAASQPVFGPTKPAPHYPTAHTANVAAWQRRFANALQAAGENCDTIERAKGMSKDELSVAGALLALGRPVNPHPGWQDERHVRPKLWSPQTINAAIEMTVEKIVKVGERTGQDNDDHEIMEVDE